MYTLSAQLTDHLGPSRSPRCTRKRSRCNAQKRHIAPTGDTPAPVRSCECRRLHSPCSSDTTICPTFRRTSTWPVRGSCAPASRLICRLHNCVPYLLVISSCYSQSCRKWPARHNRNRRRQSPRGRRTCDAVHSR